MQEFTMVKKGYDPNEVEKYVGQLERTIEEYKSRDSAISSAILNAQIAADNIIRNAHIHADEMRQNAILLLDEIHTSVQQQKIIVDTFQSEYNNLVNKYLTNPNGKHFLDIFGRINDLENYIDGLKNLDKPTEKAQGTQAPTQELAQAAATAEPQAPVAPVAEPAQPTPAEAFQETKIFE